MLVRRLDCNGLYNLEKQTFVVAEFLEITGFHLRFVENRIDGFRNFRLHVMELKANQVLDVVIPKAVFEREPRCHRNAFAGITRRIESHQFCTQVVFGCFLVILEKRIPIDKLLF